MATSQALTQRDSGPALRPGESSIRGLPKLLFAAVKKFFADDCQTMAAALSFSTVFSLPALLGLLLLLLGAVVDPADVQRAITTQVGGLIGQSGGEQVQTILENARPEQKGFTVATILGIVTLLLGATAAFAQLQGALNRAWNVKPDPKRGTIRTFLTKRVFSFGIVVVLGFLLLVSLSVSAALAALSDRINQIAGVPALLLQAVTLAISFVVVATLFAVMFKYLPDAKISWRDVRGGAIGTALLFVLGKALIGLYLGKSDPGSAFGAAGALAVILIWLYYSSMIVLFGAEFTRLWAQRHGKRVKPEPGAIAVVNEEKPVRAG
jgi:membrane protein